MTSYEQEVETLQQRGTRLEELCRNLQAQRTALRSEAKVATAVPPCENGGAPVPVDGETAGVVEGAPVGATEVDSDDLPPELVDH